MHQILTKQTWAYSLLLILVAFVNPAFSQQTSVSSIRSSEAPLRLESAVKSEPVGASESTRILAAFVAAETKVREALNQHTFKRDVSLQTIGPNGEVTGEYVRNSQFIFDDRGNRVERVLFHPRSTLRGMKITKEDIQDLAGAQLLGVDINELDKYFLTFVGEETLHGRLAYIIDVGPKQRPDPHR